MKSAKKLFPYTAIIQRDKEGNHLVSFPSLPGCVTFGRTFDEALRMGQEILELWLEELAESGKDLPKEEFTSVTVLHAPRPLLRRHSQRTYASAKRQRA